MCVCVYLCICNIVLYLISIALAGHCTSAFVAATKTRTCNVSSKDRRCVMMKSRDINSTNWIRERSFEDDVAISGTVYVMNARIKIFLPLSGLATRRLLHMKKAQLKTHSLQIDWHAWETGGRKKYSTKYAVKVARFATNLNTAPLMLKGLDLRTSRAIPSPILPYLRDFAVFLSTRRNSRRRTSTDSAVARFPLLSKNSLLQTEISKRESARHARGASYAHFTDT